MFSIEKFKNLHAKNSNINIELECSMDQFFANVDEFWYRQLLTNLISNSINYSDNDSSTITIKLALEQADKCNKCIVSVKDQGIGIPESELKTIFEPFTRGSKKNNYSKGTGLGLTICKEIVETHGGTILALNNSDVGTTIKFDIPANKSLD